MPDTERSAETQVYVLPTPNGWSAACYGDDVIPDDSIVPLPLTTRATYAEAIEHVRSTPLGAGLIDGWETAEDLARLEPDLAARVAPATPETFLVIR